MKNWVVMLLISIAPALVSSADDHGNSAAASTFIAQGSTGVVGFLETDIDEDWFRFMAAPSLVYTIRVNNVSLWDNSFAVKAFSEGTVVASTNSAHLSSPGAIVWTNSGGLRNYYIGVSALFQFTTGTYSVAISTNDYDLDADGMADVWEMVNFGNLTNNAAGDNDSDGVSNGDEYKSGTAPANFASRLSVTNIKRSASGPTVSWPGTALGTYRVEASTDLRFATNWQFKTRIYHGSSPGAEQYLDTTGTNGFRFYRVIYEY